MSKINKLKFYTTHNYRYLYNCLLENNDVDEPMKNHVIKVICDNCSIDVLLEFLNDNKRLNLTKYNISDLIISICNKCDNSYISYNTLVCAIAIEGLRPCDTENLTSKICEIGSTYVADNFVQNARVLYKEDYSNLFNLYTKNGTLSDIHSFLNLHGKMLEQSDIENFTYNLCAKQSIYRIAEFLTLECMESQKDYIINILCMKATSAELVDITIKYQNLLSLKNIDTIVCELCKKDDLKIEYILSLVFNVNYISVSSLRILTKRVIKFDVIDEILKFARTTKYLTRDSITDLTNYVCQKNISRAIYGFALNTPNLSVDNINDLVKAIIKTKNIEYIYLFALNINNISDDDKKDLIEEIILSQNMKYICLTAIFIDNSLIFRLFKSVDLMLIYIVNKKILSANELLDVEKKLFDNIDINNIEKDSTKNLYKLKMSIDNTKKTNK